MVLGSRVESLDAIELPHTFIVGPDQGIETPLLQRPADKAAQRCARSIREMWVILSLTLLRGWSMFHAAPLPPKNCFIKKENTK
jgi:hypothetical protein